ncbi:MAG: VOC family protein [Chloroflexi bacterium]|nr:VOC family protein [Chloroflexota bacterium]
MVKPKQLGHLVLRVRDIDRSEAFYNDVLGLHTTTKRPGAMVFLSAGDDASHELALMSVGPDAPGPEKDRVGLYHFAWEMESFEDLKELYKDMKTRDDEPTSTSVSQATEKEKEERKSGINKGRKEYKHSKQ